MKLLTLAFVLTAAHGFVAPPTRAPTPTAAPPAARCPSWASDATMAVVAADVEGIEAVREALRCLRMEW